VSNFKASLILPRERPGSARHNVELFLWVAIFEDKDKAICPSTNDLQPKKSVGLTPKLSIQPWSLAFSPKGISQPFLGDEPQQVH
jgi:hypothetical protein